MTHFPPIIPRQYSNPCFQQLLYPLLYLLLSTKSFLLHCLPPSSLALDSHSWSKSLFEFVGMFLCVSPKSRLRIPIPPRGFALKAIQYWKLLLVASLSFLNISSGAKLSIYSGCSLKGKYSWNCLWIFLLFSITFRSFSSGNEPKPCSILSVIPSLSSFYWWYSRCYCLFDYHCRITRSREKCGCTKCETIDSNRSITAYNLIWMILSFKE